LISFNQLPSYFRRRPDIPLQNGIRVERQGSPGMRPDPDVPRTCGHGWENELEKKASRRLHSALGQSLSSRPGDGTNRKPGEREKMKKVILIGGTSFSGSTLLDLMLSNTPEGFSCGEVSALFYKAYPHHINPRCGCGNPECRLWKEYERVGPKHLYESIFQDNPDLDYIVDSSKDVLWIKQQMKYAVKRDYSVENLLIWKTPEEFALSCMKRDRLQKWEKEWIGYHKRYFSVVGSDLITVKYYDIAKQPKHILPGLCRKVGLPFTDGQEHYWTKKHHLLFGSASTRIHLYPENHPEYARLKEVMTKRRRFRESKVHYGDLHRMIFYDNVGKMIPAEIKQEIERSESMRIIKDKLEKHCYSRAASEVLETATPQNKIMLWPLFSMGKRAIKKNLLHLHLTGAFSE
jgi:hypothetical protein